MRTLVFVAPWENSAAVAPLPPAPRGDVVVLCTVSRADLAALPWHRQRVVLWMSAQAHFVAELRAAGWTVDHREGEDHARAIAAAAAEHGVDRVVASVPREWALRTEFIALAGTLKARGVALQFQEDRGFIATRAEFEGWAEGRKELRMEWFYRELRRRHAVLVDADGKPEGGQWNFDHDNRKPWPRGRAAPPRMRVEPDAMTRGIMAQVAEMPGLWGTLQGFALPVTRAETLAFFERWVGARLPEFGPYEDAMVPGEPELLHSSISSSLNVGLVHPMELVRRVERAYHEGGVPLASAEGFIRQVLGWREYVRGLYRQLMPGFRTVNALQAPAPLPRWYWDPDGTGGYGDGPPAARCEMACVSDAARQVRDHGRTHHIARLMVLSNLATLLGVEPAQLNRWFWAGFTDAWEWVELPNVMGMATFGDGGVMASKPYVSSGAYINRMSSYCGGCRYDVSQRTGPDACPFNFLYWDFMHRHRDRFRGHPRIGALLKTLDRLGDDEVARVRAQAEAFRAAVPWDARHAPPAP